MEHTLENYLPATCRFFISVLNDLKDEITIDVENFVTLDVGEYKITPKIFKNEILSEEPKISSNPEEEEKEIESEMSQMINQLKLNEKSKIFSLKGQILDDVITKQVLKPTEYLTCEITFSILMEYRYEKDFMMSCKKMYFSFLSKETLIAFESEFDQKEIDAFYKGFVPGSKMIVERNKKYPTWKSPEISKPIPVMTEEEWLESMEK